MEAEKLKQLERKETEHIADILNEFNKKYADLLSFDSFRADNLWHDLWLAIFGILDDTTLAPLHSLCLNTVRILTRDEFSLQTNYIEQELNTLLTLARIDGNTVSTINLPATPDELLEQEKLATASATHVSESEAASSHDIIAEALKCLCNLVYQSADCRRQCLRQHCVDAILKRVASSMRHPCALEYYDMKLLFLLTALEPKARTRLQIDLNGLTYMTKWLDDKLAEPACSDEQLNIICELLKVMFNVTSSPDKSPNEYEIQSLHLTGVLRELLLRFGHLKTERERAVVTHAINLLTNISGSCLIELTLKCSNSDQQLEQESEHVDAASAPVAANSSQPTKCCALCFEKRNVRCLEVLLNYLRQVLAQQEAEASSHELLSPVLTVLVKCARSDRTMRHYLRAEILPPLRDVHHRPEIGHELRNYLCRFLTLPAMILRDLSAELLFVLCKEDVNRMIKYTGYGNAAGLFARLGLLDCRRMESTEYSSDSEDSDTEEYKKLQQHINPVSGCYEMPKHNPFEGMSEEQKEYEAVQLVSLIDKLQKGNILQPAYIDKDGKPQPLEHILQLQEELPQQQLEQKRKF
ncbi:synembryn [Scaptodrosophila lebanonensis]|uniref:Synembryn n=1 Tax=Drosophila lebanonensis TaxID=7225 RepID=A0A6J2TUR0_DROLE|nr:synembryn [Scaptodrosophila lebanonensis]